jgi:hypothetical protein
MSDTKVRKVGTVRLGGKEYDLAMNGEGLLALESPDVYGRPAARRVSLHEAAGVGLSQQPQPEEWPRLAQNLLTLLAQTMIERDAALASLQKGS